MLCVCVCAQWKDNKNQTALRHMVGHTHHRNIGIFTMHREWWQYMLDAFYYKVMRLYPLDAYWWWIIASTSPLLHCKRRISSTWDWNLSGEFKRCVFWQTYTWVNKNKFSPPNLNLDHSMSQGDGVSQCLKKEYHESVIDRGRRAEQKKVPL